MDNIDELIRALLDLINKLNNYSPSPNFLSGGDIVALFIAGVSLVGTFVISWRTNRITMQTNKDNIDANITAAARIEWIQNVRHATAELITAYWKVISSKPDEIEQNKQLAHEKTALLVLYFGPDNDSTAEAATDLHDKKTNKGKNDLLVKFIEELHSDLRMYHSKKLEQERSRKSYAECMSCQNPEDEEDARIAANCYKNEFFDQYTAEECSQNIKSASDNIQEIEKFNCNLFSRISELSEIIRIYGKLEWNRAKGGK